MRTLGIVCLTLTLSVAVSAQRQSQKQTQVQQQNQHQTVNSNNDNQNSHNVTADGGTAGATAGADSGGNSFSSSNDYQRQTSTAVGTTVFHTSPCIKSWGGGAQSGYAGLSLGGGKVDKGCDIRETAEEFRNAGSLIAFCKLMIQEPNAKKAKVTLEDCMSAVSAGEATAPVAPVAVAPPPTIVVPAPVVTVNVPPAVIHEPEPPMNYIQTAPLPVVKAPATKKRKASPVNCPTVEK